MTCGILESQCTPLLLSIHLSHQGSWMMPWTLRNSSSANQEEMILKYLEDPSQEWLAWSSFTSIVICSRVRVIIRKNCLYRACIPIRRRETFFWLPGSCTYTGSMPAHLPKSQYLSHPSPHLVNHSGHVTGRLGQGAVASHRGFAAPNALNGPA